MKYNKKNKIVTVVMAVFFLGLSVYSWCKPSEAFSDSERRALAQVPEISVGQIVSGRFMTDFETYSLDQFPFRDSFREIKAVVNTCIYRQLDNNGIYIKDGYISKMEYPLNPASISYAAKRLRYVYEKYLENTDVQTYLSIIPDKNYYLKDGRRLKLDYQSLVTQMKEETAFAKYIDIMDMLKIEHYYKTDTHWKQEYLVPVAKRIASEMGVVLENSYEEKQLETKFYGVYYGQAALPMKPDRITYLTNPMLERVTVYDHQNNKKGTIYDMEKANGKDPYEMFLSGPLSFITIENETADTQKELVVFRDSFGSSIVPLFAEGYRKITVVDIRYIHPDMLGRLLEFDKQDVLFLYSTLVLNNSEVFK